MINKNWSLKNQKSVLSMPKSFSLKSQLESLAEIFNKRLLLQKLVETSNNGFQLDR